MLTYSYTQFSKKDWNGRQAYRIPLLNKYNTLKIMANVELSSIVNKFIKFRQKIII